MGEQLNVTFDPQKFSLMLATDTCSVWNVLSSRKLLNAANSAKITFCMTSMVLYECLQKPRKKLNDKKHELMQRLIKAREKNQFPQHDCKLEALLYINQIAPKKLNSGELSSIALAYDLRTLAFMSDEKAARKFAENKVQLKVETTPKLYGWLHYSNKLSDSDHSHIINEHESFEDRPLTEFLNKAYETACAYKCKVT